MVEFFDKQSQAMAKELDSLLRIVSVKRTAAVRLAFGRALHKAFTIKVPQHGGHATTVGLEWIADRENVVADVLGNASAFFESLASTISAKAIVSQPELFKMIDPAKRQQFVLLTYSTHSPLLGADVQDALKVAGLTEPQLQRVMLQLFEQYSDNPDHSIWVSLSRYYQAELEWDALWRHLSADETRRVLLAIARAQPDLLITKDTNRICSLLAHRLTADVVDEIFELALGNVKMNRYSALWGAEAGYAPVMLSSISYKKYLAAVWSAEDICWLAGTSPHELDLSVYGSGQLFDGLEYVSHRLAVYRKRQYDCWPLFRMQRWCLEALLVQGYVEASLVIETGEHGGAEYVAYHDGVRHTAFNSCTKMSAGTRVLFSPLRGDSVMFHFVIEM